MKRILAALFFLSLAGPAAEAACPPSDVCAPAGCCCAVEALPAADGCCAMSADAAAQPAALAPALQDAGIAVPLLAALSLSAPDTRAHRHLAAPALLHAPLHPERAAPSRSPPVA